MRICWFCHFSLRCANFFIVRTTIRYRLETLLLPCYTKIHGRSIFFSVYTFFGCNDGFTFTSKCKRNRKREKETEIVYHFFTLWLKLSWHRLYVHCMRAPTSVCNVNSICFIGRFAFFAHRFTIFVWTRTNNNFVNVLYSFVIWLVAQTKFPQKRRFFFLWWN